MSGIETASLFATLVGLICNWRDERGRQTDDRFQDFLTWLTNHKFEKLREQISLSDELTRELNALLEEDLQSLSEKLDVITSTLTAVSSKIDQLSRIGNAMGVSADAISEQAFAILKAFEESAAEKMIVFNWPITIAFDKRGGASPILTVSEPRFLEADIDSLLQAGLINLTSYNGSGDPIYSLTRSGAIVARSINVLPSKGVGDPFT
jgi:hypothetical protein